MATMLAAVKVDAGNIEVREFPEPEIAEVQAAAGVIGRHVEVLKAVTDRDIDATERFVCCD